MQGKRFEHTFTSKKFGFISVELFFSFFILEIVVVNYLQRFESYWLRPHQNRLYALLLTGS